MADQQITIKDASAASKLLLAKVNGDGSFSFYHVEDVAQRAALLAALAPLATAAEQSIGNAFLATIATQTANLATAAGQTTGNTALASIVTNTARPGAVSITGTISANGASTVAQVRGDFNISFWGTFTATIRIERSFDNGTTWLPLTALGTVVTYTTPATEIFSEPQAGVRYRVNVTDISSGTVNYLISQ